MEEVKEVTEAQEVQEIDIDACLADSPDGKFFWVELVSDSLFPQGAPSLKVEADLKRQRKLIDKFSAPVMAIAGAGNVQEMAFRFDNVALAEAMIPFVKDWKGIKGTFDRAKLKTWFDRFPAVAEAFGQNIKGVLSEFEARFIRREGAIVKNS